MKHVTIHTDGGCQGNPGPGGWAAILSYGEHTREISGGELETTNNRMEMQAAIQGLTLLKEACKVRLYTDSKYLMNGVQSWVSKWKRNGWKTSSGGPVKNVDLWKRLDELCLRHSVQWGWLKGHAGHSINERCDALARAATARMAGSPRAMAVGLSPQPQASHRD